MTDQQAQVEDYGVSCWWCGKPADPNATMTVTMTKEEVLTYSKSRIHSKEVSILRCQQCMAHQAKTDWVTVILSLVVFMASVGACYFGYELQGRSGWMQYTFGITTFIILILLMVAWGNRRDRRMPEEYHVAKSKNISDHLMIVDLKEDGWQVKN